MKKENKKNKGFSLVELIIVIAIMVILGAIIAPQYFKHVNNAKISSDIETAARISSAISAEYATQSSSNTPTLIAYNTIPIPATPRPEWVVVSDASVSAVVGTVGNSKVEKDSKFYYSLSANGDVRIGIAAAAATTVAPDHIISPMNTVDATNKWK
jgi:prepilin-type N-terminal cleavage/methylation domain-containing protein